jgi:hypothetical protein
MDVSTRTRRAISTVLAVILAVEAVSVVAAAAATRTVTHELPAVPPVAQVLSAEAIAAPAGGPVGTAAVAFSAPASATRVVEPESGTSAGQGSATRPTPDVIAAGVAKAAAADAAAKARTAAEAAAKAKVAAAANAKAATNAKAAAKSSAKAKAAAKARSASSGASSTSYSGRNHVWIPSLGISRSVRWFPCERSRPPDNYMYRWGCAGSDNVYLMGHASGVMNALHDAYVSGRLSKGMEAWYANPDGTVRQYVVKWWKLTRPTTDAAWAWASQSVPSMTLQTCVGRNNEYRLMVRLVVVDG